MRLLDEGKGLLVGWHDPDEARDWVIHNKSRTLRDKRMSVADAVSQFVHQDSFIVSGAFGQIRISMAIIYEIIRQRKRNLIMAGKTATHDADLLITSGCVDRVESAYICGHELRGLSPGARRMVEGGHCTVVAETSNAGYQWRFLAAMMGLPFIPSRNLLGTDTFAHSSCKMVEDPFSGKPICLIPAAYPDVAFIHVHRCDMYGNAQIDGIIVEDFEIARSARRLILTTEQIIDHEVIRSDPARTCIPFMLVDAVVEVPYGSHPAEMPGLYYFDEDHIAEWLRMSRTDEGTDDYLRKYVFGVDSFGDYLQLCGGEARLHYLREREFLLQPMTAPWRRDNRQVDSSNTE